ncbi:MAG: hypothetical protein V3S43_06240 [Acidimicrobiia bacterium]
MLPLIRLGVVGEGEALSDAVLALGLMKADGQYHGVTAVTTIRFPWTHGWRDDPRCRRRVYGPLALWTMFRWRWRCGRRFKIRMPRFDALLGVYRHDRIVTDEEAANG